MTSYSVDKTPAKGDLVVVDRRHSAVALHNEPTLVDETISYDLAMPSHRSALSHDLFMLVKSIFSRIPEKRIYLHDERDFLLDAIKALANEQRLATLFVHKDAIQNHLNKLPAILDEILFYSANGRKMRQELFITWNLRSYIRKLKTLLNRPFSSGELDNLSRNSGDLKLTLSAEFAYLGMGSSNPVSLRRSTNQQQEQARKKIEAQQEKIVLQDWLCNISPDLLVAYRETDDIFAEAETLASSPEDEYFLEQVNADYYPHIFGALGKFEGENADFDAKELVVVESLKQFKIIQLGLQKIIDNTVAQNLTSIKSQTDFLRNKVLGERSFSLSPNEAEAEIEKSVEESQRIREELYKKHVAPKLEQNRLEYEKSLTEQKTSHHQKLENLTKSHAREMHRQDVELRRTYGSEVSKYKNLASDYRDKYSNELKSSEMKHRTDLKNLRESYDAELRRLNKQKDYTITCLQSEILSLQTSLLRQTEIIEKRATWIPSQKPETSENFNTAKAELYDSSFYHKKNPSHYRKATQEELCEIYEDDEWYDYDHF